MQSFAIVLYKYEIEIMENNDPSNARSLYVERTKQYLDRSKSSGSGKIGPKLNRTERTKNG